MNSSKRLRQSKSSGKCHLSDIDDNKPALLSLPPEILLEILSYLDCQDFYSLRQVSSRFECLEPSVWKVYEVSEAGPTTSEVIHQLKRMPLLSKISIEGRPDVDDILRQLALSNRRLEKLRINNCTGSTGQLYLRSYYLTRILERCTRLHTISIEGCRLRGQKFYRLLANKGLKLKSFSCTATAMQFREFSKNANHLEANDRLTMHNMCIGSKTSWSPLRYFIVHSGATVVKQRHTALVTYLCQTEFISIKC